MDPANEGWESTTIRAIESGCRMSEGEIMVSGAENLSCEVESLFTNMDEESVRIRWTIRELHILTKGLEGTETNREGLTGEIDLLEICGRGI